MSKVKLKPIHIHSSSLKPTRIPQGFVLVRDTREQLPLFADPQEDLQVIVSTLHNGDYSIRGFEGSFAIERKQISDFYSYIGKERERTIRKMQQFKHIVSSGGFVGLVVECPEEELLSGYIMSRVSPETARQALTSFEVRYGIHCYYSRSRRNIERWVLDRAIKFYNVQREVGN